MTVIKDILLCCDVGILLTESDEEFDYYSHVYDHKYGYYDENQISYRSQDIDEAIDYAKYYVNKGVDMTYAVVTNQGEHEYEPPFDNGIIEDFKYSCEDIIYSVAKINGCIVENFIDTKSK